MLRSPRPFLSVFGRCCATRVFWSHLTQDLKVGSIHLSSQLLLQQPRLFTTVTMAPAQCCADVHVIPMLQDNFSYLIADRATKAAACVDPYTPQKVLAKAQQLGVNLAMCLTTHRHHDHSGGNEELRQLAPNLPFVGSAYEPTPCTTEPKKHDDTFSLGSLSVRTLHAPCHTRGHMLYYITNPQASNEAPLLFTGDTLFIAGCGRFFEGGAEEMIRNMKLIRSLRDDTRLYVGHEYTVKNLRFAQALEPGRQEVKQKLECALATVGQGCPTVPAILAEERTYNPFLRFDDPALMKALGTSDPVTTMAECRARKDCF